MGGGDYRKMLSFVYANHCPVMYYGKLNGYLFTSPFLLFDPSELQPEELLSLLGKRQEKNEA